MKIIVSSTNNEEEEEKSSSSSDDDETTAKEVPMNSVETCKRGIVANTKISPTLSMFGVLEDNIVTSQRIHFESTNSLDN